MLRNNVIVLATNAKLSDGCDYAIQTMRILSATNRVYMLLLGEPLVWRDVLRLKRWPAVERKYGCVLIHPFFVIPGQRILYIKTLNYFLNAVVARIALVIRHGLRRKLFWFFEPWNIVPLFVAFAGYTSLYDCVDYFRALAYEPFSRERYLVQHASVMTCISEALAAQYRSYRHDVHIVPLGFSKDQYRSFSSRRLRRKKQFTVVFIGGINYRIDFPLLFSVITALPHIRFEFAGPIQKGLISSEEHLESFISKIFAFPNVTYRGNIEKREIGGLLASCDVGIIPYDARFAFNRFSYPMKVMEYFWYGLPVVSTDITPLRAHKHIVYTKSSSAEWVRILRRLQAGKPSSTRKIQQRTVAASNTWRKKLEAISRLQSFGRA